jgi:hypothetical protein
MGACAPDLKEMFTLCVHEHREIESEGIMSLNVIMEPEKNIDPVLNIRYVLENMFRMFVPNPSARRFFHIKGISEKIYSLFGLYLWFFDRPGAYLMELTDAAALDPWPAEGDEKACCEDVCQGRFQLKYYPDPSEDCFKQFSPCEQSLRMSDLFDETGTPKTEEDDAIPDHLFCVGTLDIGIGNEGTFLEMRLTSSDGLITATTGEDGFCCGETHHSRSQSSLGGDSAVPAWELSWFLLDRLVCGLCYFYGTRPDCVALFEESGIHMNGRYGRIAEYLCHDEKVRRLLGFFSIRDEHGGQKKKKKSMSHGYIEAQLRREIMQSAKLVRSDVDEPSNGPCWINPEWWRAREFEISAEGVDFCNCCDDDHCH